MPVVPRNFAGQTAISLNPSMMNDSAPHNGPFTHREQLLAELSEPYNRTQLLVVERWLTETPPITTIRVNLLKTSVTAVKELVTGSFVSKYGADKELTFVFHPQYPELLGIAPLKDTENNRYGDVEISKEIIVDSNGGRSILRGANLFAPGVLAMSKKCAEGDLVNVYVDLEGKCKKGAYEFVDSDRLFIGIGKVLQPRYKIYGESITPSGIAVDMISTIYPHVPSIGDAYLSDSDGILQNFPSMIAVRALNPSAGETILDMCATPGHKTHHIVEMMGDTGTVIAMDKVKKKIIEMQRKTDELGYKSLKCFSFDSAKCIDPNATHLIINGPPFPPGSFDKVLLDAPCSGLGNRPQLPLSNKMTVKMLQSYPVLQKQLFFAAVAALKIGGILVYSTCTINQHENEGMVAWALNKFRNLQLLPIESEFGSTGWPTTGLNDDQTKLIKRFGAPPQGSSHSLHNTIGFFIAKFIKNSA